MGANWKPRWGVGTVIAAAGTVIAAVQLQQAKRDSERAFRESPEGRLQEAMHRMMRPHDPAKAKEQVVARKAAVDASVVLAGELVLLGRLRSLFVWSCRCPQALMCHAWCQVMQDIRDRISSWKEHATVVTGRYGSGKSVAVHEALRGLPGVYFHTVKNASWEDTLYKELQLDGPGMLKELFNRVATELKKDPEAPFKVPVLVLDIPRETTQGAALGFRCPRLLSRPEA